MTTKGVPYSWEISQPDGNDEGTDISKYSSLGAPVPCLFPKREGGRGGGGGGGGGGKTCNKDLDK